MLQPKKTLTAMAGAMLLLTATPSLADDVFLLSSPAFHDGGRLTLRNAGNSPQNPNCVGENISPPLSWANPPAGTRSYAILMFDPEGRPPAGVSHWVAYGIPAAVTELAEGEASEETDKYVGGKNTLDLSYYLGPCPAPGAPHHYIFTLFATTLEPDHLPAGLRREEVLKALEGHVTGVTGLVGVFSR